MLAVLFRTFARMFCSLGGQRDGGYDIVAARLQYSRNWLTSGLVGISPFG